MHSCAECGTAHPKWSGQCTGCGAWNTLLEEVLGPAVGRGPASGPVAMSTLDLLSDIDALLAAPQPTGIAELDRVLGGGLVAGSVTLLGGEPGIGKSTLLLQLLACVAGHHALRQRRGVRPAGPPARRAARRRCGPTCGWPPRRRSPDVDRRHRPHGTVAGRRRQHPDHRRPAARRRAPGSVVQVRECAQPLVGEAKRRGVPIVLVGHVTKDGALAGPRVLEHIVDTVLSFEGERHHALRLLRAVKHRFGSTDELGLFEMTGTGLHGRARPVEALPRRPARRRRRVGRRAGDGGPAAAARRGPGADRPGPTRRRRRGATPRASTAAAWPCCSRSSSGGPGCAWPTRTSTRRRSVACGSSSRASTSAVAMAVASAVADQPIGARRRRDRRDRPRRRGAPGRPRPAPPRARRPASGSGGPSCRRRRRRARASTLRAGADASPRRCAAVGIGASRRRMPRPARPLGSTGWPTGTAAPTTRLRDALATGRAGHAAARRHRPSRAGQGRRAARARRRPDGAGDLLGRVPRRRSLQPAAALRAGQDGRGDHHLDRRQPHRPGQRPPGARTRRCRPARPAPVTARPSGSPAR